MTCPGATQFHFSDYGFHFSNYGTVWQFVALFFFKRPKIFKKILNDLKKLVVQKEKMVLENFVSK